MEFSASKYQPWRPLAHRRLRWWPRETGEKHATFYFCMGPGLGGGNGMGGRGRWNSGLAKVVVVLCTMSGVDDVLLLPSFVFIFFTVTGPSSRHRPPMPWDAEKGKWDIY